jgi:hypothetical protein
MADIHGVATADDDLDLEAHETTYVQFIALTQLVISLIFCIILLLVLWGLKGHPMLALLGFLITAGAGAMGGLTGLGWKMVAPVFLLLGLACLVL